MASVRPGTFVPIAASTPGQDRATARSGLRVANASGVALVGGSAEHGAAGDAGTRLTGVVLLACVSIAAGGAVGLVGEGASAIAIAGPGLMTLVRGRAREGGAGTNAGRAYVVVGARVYVE